MKPTPTYFSKIVFAPLSLLLTLTLFQPAYSQSDFEMAELLFSQAVLAYDDGRYADALRDLRKAHALDPQNMNVIYYLGLTLNRQANHAEAATYLLKGLEREPKNYDMRYQLGVALYRQDNYDAALKELLNVYEAQPQRDNLGYYVGLCYYHKKDYENALNYFLRNVSTDVRTRQLNQLYTGLTLRAMGRIEEAMEELAEAIRIEPTSPIVGTTQQLLTALRATRVDAKPLRLELTTRVQYDSNGALLPTLALGGVSQGRKDSWGNLINFRLDYNYLQSENWESTATYNFLQTINYQKHNFDLHYHLIEATFFYKDLFSSGQALFAGQPFFIGTQVSYDLLLGGNRKVIERPTGTLSFTLAENPSNFSTIFFRLQYRDFFERQKVRKGGQDDEQRDAINKLFGLVHSIRLFGAEYQVNFGYHYDNEDAQGRNWRYQGHKAIAGLLISLPWEIKATTNFEFHIRYYKGANSNLRFLNNHRQDQERTVLFSLTRDITRDLTLTLEHLWDNTQSTIAFFKTRRQIYSLGLTWRY